MWHDETQRPDYVGGVGEEHFALLERFPDEAKGVLLKVAQSAVNELGTCRRRAATQIVLLEEQHLQATASRIPLL